MADERRGGRRAPISGVRVTYEGATGAKIEADVLDLATGGMFIRTESPLATGKRIALDLHIMGEPGPWSALGRVVWTRAAAEPGRPAGMGVKLIDVDDETIDAIARLVETREPTAPGVGKIEPTPIVALGVGAPERERTLMGVGADSDPPTPMVAKPAAPAPPPPPPQPAPPLPSPEPAPAREPEAPHPPREQSVAIDLVTAKSEVVEAPPPAPPAAAPRPASVSVPPRGDSGGSSARWVVVVLLLVVAGIAAYVLFDGFLKPMGR
jgi:uncharacterized protein (TIGR02266 family)